MNGEAPPSVQSRVLGRDTSRPIQRAVVELHLVIVLPRVQPVKSEMPSTPEQRQVCRTRQEDRTNALPLTLNASCVYRMPSGNTIIERPQPGEGLGP
jgi:hypothetical protein